MAAETVDALVLGAGAAGLFCALTAAARGRRVRVLDHNAQPGRKILVSGGGRCNFTNRGAGPANYTSLNPHFCVSALSRFPASRFIEWVDQHGIPWHEKKLGQLFCDGSARDLLSALLEDLEHNGARMQTEVEVLEVEGRGPFRVRTSAGEIRCDSLVVATGGLSLPKLGASGLAYRLAGQYGVPVVPTRPALVPLTVTGVLKQVCGELAGVSAEVCLTATGGSFRENLLFTHRGLSGPAVLQVSSLLADGDELSIDWLPGRDAARWLEEQCRQFPGRTLPVMLAEVLPKRLAQALCDHFLGNPVPARSSAGDRKELAARLSGMIWKPAASEGYRTAEVTRGGIDTRALDSRTMAVRDLPGLHFIGECVDVTGWLGGYNFQWAWSSGWAAAQVI